MLLILTLAAALRLLNLGVNPGWDGDEGYNYNIALNLAQGHRQMFALAFAFVQHPPLFFLLAAGLFHLFGATMFNLRLLSIIYCLGTLLLLRPLAYELVDGRHNQMAQRIAFLAMLAYAVIPLVALQNRFAYTYNGLACWTVLAALTVLRYRRTGTARALALAGLATTLALTTDQEGVYLLPVLLLGLGVASLKRRLLVFALALSGPALYLGVMALADPAALLFDIMHTAGRVAGGSLPWQAMALSYYFADLLRFDLVIPLGLAGLALAPYRPARRLLLGLLVAMLLVILKVRDPNPLFRTAEPLLPFVCLGLGALGATLWARIGPFWRGRGALGLALLLVALTGTMVTYDARAAATCFPTRIGGLLPRSTTDATAMAGWLNRRLHPTDLVIAMPQVSWALHARTAELLQAVAYEGQASAFYPAGIARQRWRYPPGLDAARFLVVDDFTHAWIAQNAPERALVAHAARGWLRVYAHGEYTIYENRAHAH
ncbi:MAG: glycosyltransferase family 39 protein [Chloroflexi bacterium]|nr:glycosyltransferase family 39 protein [Chloroflexota bacterium]